MGHLAMSQTVEGSEGKGKSRVPVLFLNGKQQHQTEKKWGQ